MSYQCQISRTRATDFIFPGQTFRRSTWPYAKSFSF